MESEKKDFNDFTEEERTSLVIKLGDCLLQKNMGDIEIETRRNINW